MEPWTQNITAPRQPDFDDPRSRELESEEVLTEPHHTAAEDPPLSRSIDVASETANRTGFGLVTSIATAVTLVILGVLLLSLF